MPAWSSRSVTDAASAGASPENSRAWLEPFMARVKATSAAAAPPVRPKMAASRPQPKRESCSMKAFTATQGPPAENSEANGDGAPPTRQSFPTARVNEPLTD
jgi:hypothetical protein